MTPKEVKEASVFFLFVEFYLSMRAKFSLHAEEFNATIDELKLAGVFLEDAEAKKVKHGELLHEPTSVCARALDEGLAWVESHYESPPGKLVAQARSLLSSLDEERAHWVRERGAAERDYRRDLPWA